MPDPKESILNRYANGERSFRGEELDSAPLDLRGGGLAGADFTEAFLIADFRGANLEGCRFDRANVKTCDFRGARLVGASFKQAAIDGALFDDMGVAAAVFDGASDQGHVFARGEKPWPANG